jgi:electron transfer flavoprotein beta subunit
LKVLVCVKQVGVLGDEVEFTDDERDVDPDYLERALNEWDAAALEEALRIRESLGEDGAAASEVVAVTVGDEESDEALRRALAMGADRAVRVSADGIDDADPLTTARGLASVARTEQPDLVLCGVQSSDSVQAAVPAMLSELLGLARVAVVIRLEPDLAAGRATAHRELEGGLLDVVEVGLPAVLTIQTGINEPRYATLRAIKQAKEKELTVVDLDRSQPGAYRVRRMFVPERGAGAELLGEDPAAVAGRISEIVKGRLS